MLISLCVSFFPFWFEGGMWDLIIAFLFYFVKKFQDFLLMINISLQSSLIQLSWQKFPLKF